MKDKYVNNPDLIDAVVEKHLGGYFQRLAEIGTKIMQENFDNERDNTKDSNSWASLADKTQSYRMRMGYGANSPKHVNTGNLKSHNRGIVLDLKAGKMEVVNNATKISSSGEEVKYAWLLHQGMVGMKGGGTQSIPRRRFLDIPYQIEEPNDEIERLADFDKAINDFNNELYYFF